MFTGIIEERGSVRSIEFDGDNARIVILGTLVTDGTNAGDSISVNGVCLTALEITKDSFAADVSRETLDRSTLGSLKAGSPVNLERAVTPMTRLGGHIVAILQQVDDRGQVLVGVEAVLVGAERLVRVNPCLREVDDKNGRSLAEADTTLEAGVFIELGQRPILEPMHAVCSL